MKIIELLEDNSSKELSLRLSGAINQIAGEIISQGSNTKMSLDAIRNKLNDLGINVSEKQLRDMADNAPLNNTIASIKGDKVTFIGQRKDTNDAIKPDQSTETLEKMAKRAEKKRK